jgi:RHS repeat-associated protein
VNAIGTTIKNSTTTYDFSWTPLSSSRTYYDDAGRVNSNIDPAGLVTKYEYDNAGRQRFVRQYLTGTLNTSTWQVEGVANAATDVLVTESQYDAAGRVTRTIDPSGVSTRFEYDAMGRVTNTVADEGGLNVATITHYDQLGRKDYEIDAIGNRTDYEYDLAGRLAAVILPEVDNPTGTGPARVRPRYEYEYDIYGNQVLIRDPMDDEFGVGTENKETHFTYDHLGRQTSRTLPDGLVETFVYDDRSLADILSAGKSLNFSTGLGQLKYSVDFEGRVIAYFYDNTPEAAGRLKSIVFYTDLPTYDNGDGATNMWESYSYDPLGRRTRVDVIGTGTYSHFAYDAEGRVLDVASDTGRIRYEYDDLGRLIRTYTGSLDDWFGSVAGDGIAITDTRYTYDRLGRLKTVEVFERFDTPLSTPEVTEYRYDKNGNLDQVETPNSVIANYDYDVLNRLEFLRHFKDNDQSNSFNAGDTELAEYQYTVRTDGKRTQAIEKIDLDGDAALDTTTIDWVYDELGRLVGEAYDSSLDNSMDYIAQYRYDLASNRQEFNVDRQPTAQTFTDFRTSGTFPAAWDEETDYTYDANDRLLSELLDNDVDPQIDRTTTYEYGGPTNPGTQQTKKSVTGDVTETHTFEYNLQGRLSQSTVDKDGTTTVNTYRYNADGIRIEQTEQVNGDTVTRTIYHIDPNNHTGYAQVLEEKNSTDVIRTYTLGHDVLSQSEADGTVYVLLYDGHGSTRLLVDGLSVVDRYAYDAFGNMLSGTGLVSDRSAALTSLLYSGERTDQTGLQYLRARYYDPRTGRFNRLDPFAGNTQDPLSLHKYLYANADPVQFVDPSGMWGLAVSVSISSTYSTGLNAGRAAAALKVLEYVGATLLATGTALLIQHTWPYLRDVLNTGVDRASDLIGTLIANATKVQQAYKAAVQVAASATTLTQSQIRQLPFLPVVRSYIPEIYAFNVSALAANPAWSVLTYNGPFHPRTNINRNIVRARWGRNGGRVGHQLDEFPFASTVQGGVGALGRLVPTFENRRQGALLTAFYGGILRFIPNSQFLVAPINV